jgi:hypothetical protein
MLALRDDIVSAPVSVGLARAQVFTRVWQENEGAPWVVLKALALREYLRPPGLGWTAFLPYNDAIPRHREHSHAPPKDK